MVGSIYRIETSLPGLYKECKPNLSPQHDVGFVMFLTCYRMPQLTYMPWRSTRKQAGASRNADLDNRPRSSPLSIKNTVLTNNCTTHHVSTVVCLDTNLVDVYWWCRHTRLLTTAKELSLASRMSRAAYKLLSTVPNVYKTKL